MEENNRSYLEGSDESSHDMAQFVKDDEDDKGDKTREENGRREAV